MAEAEPVIIGFMNVIVMRLLRLRESTQTAATVMTMYQQTHGNCNDAAVAESSSISAET